MKKNIISILAFMLIILNVAVFVGLYYINNDINNYVWFETAIRTAQAPNKDEENDHTNELSTPLGVMYYPDNWSYYNPTYTDCTWFVDFYGSPKMLSVIEGKLVDNEYVGEKFGNLSRIEFQKETVLDNNVEIGITYLNLDEVFSSIPSFKIGNRIYLVYAKNGEMMRDKIANSIVLIE